MRLRGVHDHLDPFVFRLAGGRRAARSISVTGGRQAIGLGFALFLDAHWPALRVMPEWTEDLEFRRRRIIVRYHPDRRRGDCTVIVIQDRNASEVRHRHIQLSARQAIEAAVYLAAGAPVVPSLELHPIELAEAEAAFELRDRARFVLCDCGGGMFRVPFVGSWCPSEVIDPHRRYRILWAGKPTTVRQRIADFIAIATHGWL